MKAKSKLISRLWGSLRASPSDIFITAQTRKDGDMRIGRSTASGPSNTPNQIAWRAHYSACVNEWNMMSDEQKEEYSEAAKAAGITNYNAFISACLLAPMATEVYQEDPTKLKATVTQSSIARTVTQVAKDRTVTGQVKITDGTHFMPTMDSPARRGYVQPGDENFPGEYLTTEETIPLLKAGAITLPHLYVLSVREQVMAKLGGIYDNNTQVTSIATSRAAGKSTHSLAPILELVDHEFLTPTVGNRLQICGILTSSLGDAGIISLDFIESVTPVWRHFVTKTAQQQGFDLAFVGEVDEPLTVQFPADTLPGFILVNYREIVG